MKLDVLDNKGKSTEKITLNESVFGVEPKMELIKQYLRVFTNNQRQGTSSTKERSEVRGGGRKPWRQKGTGRARHGSIRSPIWVGGGAAHGPRPKSWNLKLPKKMKRMALISILSLKNAKKQIKILDKITLKEPNTKEMTETLNNIKARGRTLVVLSENDKNAIKSINNITKTESTSWDNVNGYQLMLANTVVFVKDALVKLEEKYSTKK